MNCILLAAGLGTRLRPITNTVPKCLVEINRKALLDIWIDKLNDIGVDSILINTHYLANQVKEKVFSNPIKDKIKIVEEKELKGTAGTLIDNLDFYDGKDGILIHADNYCIDDLSKLISVHNNRNSACLMTMLTFSTFTPESCGIVEVDKNGILINFHEKKQNSPGNIANGAIYILSSEMINILNKDFQHAKDFSLEIIPEFHGLIQTYHTQDFFIDIGTCENLAMANLYKK